MRAFPDLEACINVIGDPGDAGMMARAGDIVADVAEISGLKIDAVDQEISDSEVLRTRKFRSTEKAVEFLKSINAPSKSLSGTERSRPLGEWDIGSATVSFDEAYFQLLSTFPNRALERTFQIARDILTYAASLSCNYGYLAFGPHQLFVGGAAMGMRTGGADKMSDQEQKNVGQLWRALRKGETFRDRIFDVYPANMIDPDHLDAKVGRVRLADMISAGGHGRLEKIDDEHWLWLLEPEETSATRKFLLRSDLMIAVE